MPKPVNKYCPACDMQTPHMPGGDGKGGLVMICMNHGEKDIDKGWPIGIRKIEEYQSQFDESDQQYRAIENLIQWLINESKTHP